MNRIIKLTSFIACWLLGVILGIPLGMITFSVILWILKVKFSHHSFIQEYINFIEEYKSEFVKGSGFVGSLCIGTILLQSHQKYFEILQLKRTYRLIYYEVRDKAYVFNGINNPLIDIAWAISYTLCEVLVPLALVIAALLLTVFLYGLTLLAVLVGIVMAVLAADAGVTIVDLAFSPNHLRQGIREAPLVLRVLAIQRAQQRQVKLQTAQQQKRS